MAFSFFPKSPKFFEMFLKQHSFIVQSVSALTSLFREFKDLSAKCSVISNLESQGNEISEEILKELSRAFITSIDREDIHALNIAQENLLNSIKSISSRVSLYKSEAIHKPSLNLAEYLQEIVAETTNMFNKIQAKQTADEHHYKIKKLKSEADLLLLVALGELYETEVTNPQQSINIMIWAQIYDRLEHSLAYAETLSNVLEGVSLKNV